MILAKQLCDSLWALLDEIDWLIDSGVFHVLQFDSVRLPHDFLLLLQPLTDIFHVACDSTPREWGSWPHVRMLRIKAASLTGHFAAERCSLSLWLPKAEKLWLRDDCKTTSVSWLTLRRGDVLVPIEFRLWVFLLDFFKIVCFDYFRANGGLILTSMFVINRVVLSPTEPRAQRATLILLYSLCIVYIERWWVLSLWVYELSLLDFKAVNLVTFIYTFFSLPSLLGRVGWVMSRHGILRVLRVVCVLDWANGDYCLRLTKWSLVLV